jgi:hypothetical protein
MLDDLVIYFISFFLTLLALFGIRSVYEDMRDGMSKNNPYKGHSF